MSGLRAQGSGNRSDVGRLMSRVNENRWTGHCTHTQRDRGKCQLPYRRVNLTPAGLITSTTDNRQTTNIFMNDRREGSKNQCPLPPDSQHSPWQLPCRCAPPARAQQGRKTLTGAAAGAATSEEETHLLSEVRQGQQGEVKGLSHQFTL